MFILILKVKDIFLKKHSKTLLKNYKYEKQWQYWPFGIEKFKSYFKVTNIWKNFHRFLTSKYDLNIKIIKILFFEKLYHFSNIINNGLTSVFALKRCSKNNASFIFTAIITDIESTIKLLGRAIFQLQNNIFFYSHHQWFYILANNEKEPMYCAYKMVCF